MLAGALGWMDSSGPARSFVIADETGNAKFIAADLIAQAEHDPGSCFLLTTSEKLAQEVEGELSKPDGHAQPSNSHPQGARGG